MASLQLTILPESDHQPLHAEIAIHCYLEVILNFDDDETSLVVAVSVVELKPKSTVISKRVCSGSVRCWSLVISAAMTNCPHQYGQAFGPGLSYSGRGRGRIDVSF